MGIKDMNEVRNEKTETYFVLKMIARSGGTKRNYTQNV